MQCVNIRTMVTTLAVSQSSGWLNRSARENMKYMVVTRLVSNGIGPLNLVPPAPTASVPTSSSPSKPPPPSQSHHFKQKENIFFIDLARLVSHPVMSSSKCSRLATSWLKSHTPDPVIAVTSHVPTAPYVARHGASDPDSPHESHCDSAPLSIPLLVADHGGGRGGGGRGGDDGGGGCCGGCGGVAGGAGCEGGDGQT